LRCLPVDDFRKIRVREENSGKDLLTQPVDLDQDGKADELVFQSDFGPRETKKFSLSLGPLQLPVREDFKVYGRFVRERFDDFAWENDRIAHRMYGAALETWELEPLSSSTVDIWCKRTRRLVINDWYMVDHYHEDTGEGADFYSAGKSRGCGGSGIVFAPDSLVEIKEAEGNYLVIARTNSPPKAAYLAGFGWDRSGDFADEAAWAEYLRQAAMKLGSPLKIQFP